jgi:hypothetical protein
MILLDIYSILKSIYVKDNGMHIPKEETPKINIDWDIEITNIYMTQH